MATKKLKFPAPKDYPAKDPVVLCPTPRVKGLYEQETGTKSKRVAKNMTKWFVDEAKKHGWAGCRFLPTVQSKHSAGCILLNPQLVTITFQKITINLPKDDDVDS
jgi:hypothetical protein